MFSKENLSLKNNTTTLSEHKKDKIYTETVASS